ncbi:MAG: hypothetical protein Q7S53_04705 [bacterium]|nr:hypothetical protein [bacterium]
MGIDIKTIGKVLQEAGKIELYQQVLEMQAKMNEMQDSNYELKKENRKLKEDLELKNSLEFDHGCYWINRVEDGEETKEGPFCPHCWDKDKVALRMKDLGGGDYHCHECNLYIDIN